MGKRTAPPWALAISVMMPTLLIPVIFFTVPSRPSGGIRIRRRNNLRRLGGGWQQVVGGGERLSGAGEAQAEAAVEDPGVDGVVGLMNQSHCASD